MTASEWLKVIEQAEDYNPKLTPLIKKYGEMICKEQREMCQKKLEEDLGVQYQSLDSVLNAPMPEL